MASRRMTDPDYLAKVPVEDLLMELGRRHRDFVFILGEEVRLTAGFPGGDSSFFSCRVDPAEEAKRPDTRSRVVREDDPTRAWYLRAGSSLAWFGMGGRVGELLDDWMAAGRSLDSETKEDWSGLFGGLRWYRPGWHREVQSWPKKEDGR